MLKGRFKLHVQVMDNTGSTSIILFDCNIANYVGRSVQDLIDAQGRANNSLGYPKELGLLVGKQMLFKVEITDWNLVHNWRNHGVKRTSDDADLIKRFIEKHNIKEIAEEDDSCNNNVPLTQIGEARLESRLIEFGDSTKTGNDLVDNEQTPGSKSGGKRFADAEDSAILGTEEIGDRSINKLQKMICVKVEKLN
ncbi:putative nucleic acid-binding protein [Medicago truncatula]|uniref:Putative nucleic acid-binding protein n=1 Tax=Medicago truncatula TaxID=3880 RepID=A0A396GMD6_MEDTR|nr:putative nucleic acid-binding protein [Medicago truncatula]